MLLTFSKYQSPINKPINSEIVPEEMKFTRVRPIFQKNSPLDVSNYRSVSIFSLVSKILKRFISPQLNDFIKENNILYEYQPGFRGSLSTDTCLTHLLD